MGYARYEISIVSRFSDVMIDHRPKILKYREQTQIKPHNTIYGTVTGHRAMDKKQNTIQGLSPGNPQNQMKRKSPGPEVYSSDTTCPATLPINYQN